MNLLTSLKCIRLMKTHLLYTAAIVSLLPLFACTNLANSSPVAVNDQTVTVVDPEIDEPIHGHEILSDTAEVEAPTAVTILPAQTPLDLPVYPDDDKQLIIGLPEGDEARRLISSDLVDDSSEIFDADLQGMEALFAEYTGGQEVEFHLFVNRMSVSGQHYIYLPRDPGTGEFYLPVLEIVDNSGIVLIDPALHLYRALHDEGVKVRSFARITLPPGFPQSQITLGTFGDVDTIVAINEREQIVAWWKLINRGPHGGRWQLHSSFVIDGLLQAQLVSTVDEAMLLAMQLTWRLEGQRWVATDEEGAVRAIIAEGQLSNPVYEAIKKQFAQLDNSLQVIVSETGYLLLQDGGPVAVYTEDNRLSIRVADEQVFLPTTYRFIIEEAGTVALVNWGSNVRFRFEYGQWSEVPVSIANISNEVRIYYRDMGQGQQQIGFGLVLERGGPPPRIQGTQRYYLTGILLQEPYLDEDGMVVFPIGIPDFAAGKFHVINYLSEPHKGPDGVSSMPIYDVNRIGPGLAFGSRARIMPLDNALDVYAHAVGRQMAIGLEMAGNAGQTAAIYDQLIAQSTSCTDQCIDRIERVKSRLDETYIAFNYLRSGDKRYDGMNFIALNNNIYVPRSYGD
jgi:hypothetical protein